MSNPKLSLAKIDKIIKHEKINDINTINYKIDEKVYEITVKSYISFSDMLSFVDGVVNTIFPIGDDGFEHYVPALLEYAKALHYIEYCTNLKVELGSDRVYTMLFGSDIMRTIYKQISPTQYNAIEDAIESAIAHKLAVLQVGEQAKIADATDKIDQAARALEAFSKQFEGIDQNKMQAAFDNLAEITPKDLTGAVIDIRDVNAK